MTTHITYITDIYMHAHISTLLKKVKKTKKKMKLSVFNKQKYILCMLMPLYLLAMYKKNKFKKIQKKIYKCRPWDKEVIYIYLMYTHNKYYSSYNLK